MLYHMGDSQHTQSIQINKLIGENQICVFYCTEKYKDIFCQTNCYFCVALTRFWYQGNVGLIQ